MLCDCSRFRLDFQPFLEDDTDTGLPKRLEIEPIVGLDLMLALSKVRRCSLKRSFKRRLVSPMYCR